jgi:hypothetical protein
VPRLRQGAGLPRRGTTCQGVPTAIAPLKDLENLQSIHFSCYLRGFGSGGGSGGGRGVGPGWVRDRVLASPFGIQLAAAMARARYPPHRSTRLEKWAFGSKRSSSVLTSYALLLHRSTHLSPRGHMSGAPGATGILRSCQPSPLASRRPRRTRFCEPPVLRNTPAS